MAKLRITLKRSKIHSSERQLRTIQALGLHKTQSSVEVESSPQILGMINKIKHLLLIEEI
jgi:large subunit ribosomal protein L30